MLNLLRERERESARAEGVVYIYTTSGEYPHYAKLIFEMD